MKKILLLFIASMALSCSSDDTQTVNFDNLTGEWRQQSFRLGSTNETFDLSDCQGETWGKVFNFNDDGTISIYNACENAEMNISYTASYTIENNEVVIYNQYPMPEDVPQATIFEATYSMHSEGNNKIGLKRIDNASHTGIDDYQVFKKM